MSLKADMINYETVPIQSSHYKYQEVIKQTGGTTETITTSGGQQAVFELAPNVYNFSKFKYAMTLTPAASGASQYNWMACDGWTMIRRLQLTTRSGVHLVDIDDVAKLTNMFIRRNISQDKAVIQDTGANFFTGFSAFQGTPATNYRQTADVAEIYQEGRYTLTGGSNTATPVVNCLLDFSMLFHTLFEQDKTLFLGPDSLYLTITFAPTTQFLWFGDSATDPTSSATIYAGSVAVTGQKLWTCIDENPETVAMLKDKVAGGSLRVIYEDPLYNLSSLSGTSQNVSVRYNPGQGKRLKKIYHAIYSNTQSVNTAFDKNALADAKAKEYYIRINEKRTADYNIDTSSFNDYIFYADQKQGSNLVGRDAWYYNYVIETDFTTPYTVSKIVDGPIPWDNIEQGLPLDGEIKYDFLGVDMANATFQHIVFGVVQKELVVSSSGLSVVH